MLTATLSGTPVLLLGLAVACGGGGGGAPATAPVQVEITPRKAELTGGRQLQLGVRVIGAHDQSARWTVVGISSGTVTQGGLYTAPLTPGQYMVQAQAIVDPSKADLAQIQVFEAPAALSLTADQTQVLAGQTVNLTPEFTGGKGLLLPMGAEVTSGSAMSVTVTHSQTFTLRVTNALGATDEKILTVFVQGQANTGAPVVQDLHAPQVCRAGSHYVAWLQRRVGAEVEWSMDGGTFLGAQTHPTTQAVVFTPTPGATAFTLRVKATGGRDILNGTETHTDTATYQAQGSVEQPTGEEPVLATDRPFVTKGKDHLAARVENPKAGTTYRWTAGNATVAGTGEGASIQFKAGQAPFVVLTCEATAATGARTTSTLGLVAVDPPQAPLLGAGRHVAAGLEQWAYVKRASDAETYFWELDPAQGSFANGTAAMEGPLAAFTVRAAGHPFVLQCRAMNQAGDLSAPAALTLNPVGAFSLDPPQVEAPAMVRRGSGPHTATVAHADPSMVYTWTLTGGTLHHATGASVTFQAGTAPSLILTCAARAHSGAASFRTVGIRAVALPGKPQILAPASATPGSTHVAGVLANRAGETYEWTPVNATLAPRPAGNRGAVAPFQAGGAGAYTLRCVAVNTLGDRSEPAEFAGLVVADLPAGGGAPGAPPAPGDPSAPGAPPAPDAPSAPGAPPAPGAPSAPGAPGAPGGGTGPTGDPHDPDAHGPTATFAVSYPSKNFDVNAAIPAQTPLMVNLHPDAPVFAVSHGLLPDGLTLDAATGVITGTPVVEGAYLFRIHATSGAHVTVSPLVSYTVTPADPMTLSYPAPPAGGFPTRVPMIGQPATVAHTTPGLAVTFDLAHGALPPGLKLEPNGTLSGVPRVPSPAGAPYTFTIRARNLSRIATADLAYTVTEGPAPRITLASQTVEVTGMPFMVVPDLENMPHTELNRFSLVGAGTLPDGLSLDPAQGLISGSPTTPGTFTFVMRVADGVDQVDTAPVTFTVVPFVPLAITGFKGVPAVAQPGEPVALSWTLAGLPSKLTLTRNLETDPTVSTPGNAPPAPLPVSRRQAFTLTVTGEPAKQTRTIALATQGVEVVAGDPAYTHPAQVFANGVPAQAGWRSLAGGVWHDGKLYLTKGDQHTISAVTLNADGSMAAEKAFAGVSRGPATGDLLNSLRLNLPGPAVVIGTDLVFADAGTHTLKICPLANPAALRVLAGQAGHAGRVDCAAGGVAQFGTIKDLAWHPASGLLFVADLEHGIRMVHVATGEVRTMAPAVAHHWQALSRPVGLAVDPAGNLYVTTEFKPGTLPAAKKANPSIQVLRPAGAPALAGAWTLGLFAGHTDGYEDGPAATARFKNPVGLAVVGDSLIVADRDNHAVRKVALASGAVTTLACKHIASRGTVSTGQGFNNDLNPLQAGFKRPSRIIPGPGRIFVLDQDDSAVRVIALPAAPGDSAAVTTLGGIVVKEIPDAAVDGVAHAARLKRPTSVAVERRTGVAYVVEPATHAVRSVVLEGDARTATGKVAVIAGQLGSRLKGAAPLVQTLAAARFDEPTELGIDGKARLFVLEPKAGRVRMLDAGKATPFLTGLPVPDPAHAGARIRMAVRPGQAGLGLVLSTPHAGAWRVQWHTDAPTPAEDIVAGLAHEPRALAVGLDNTVFVLVADPARQTCAVHRYARTAAPGAAATWAETGATVFGPGPTSAVGSAWGFPEIQAMAADTKGNLFMADQANALIWMLAADGTLAPVAGTPMAHQLTGAGTRSLGDPLFMPLGVAVTGHDDLVVTCGDTLVQITAPGTASHPWTPVTADVAWTSQKKASGGGAPPPPPAAAAPGGAPGGIGDAAKRRADRMRFMTEAVTDARAAKAAGDVAAAKAAYARYLALSPTGFDAKEARDYLAANP